MQAEGKIGIETCEHQPLGYYSLHWTTTTATCEHQPLGYNSLHYAGTTTGLILLHANTTRWSTTIYVQTTLIGLPTTTASSKDKA